MSDNEQNECEHSEAMRFFAPDEDGNDTMLCGECGMTVILMHACETHRVLGIMPPGADVGMIVVSGDVDAPCVAADVTLESLLTA